MFQNVGHACVVAITGNVMQRIFLYRNGYTVAPWSLERKPLVDQAMRPHELWEVSGDYPGYTSIEEWCDDGSDY